MPFFVLQFFNYILFLLWYEQKFEDFYANHPHLVTFWVILEKWERGMFIDGANFSLYFK